MPLPGGAQSPGAGAGSSAGSLSHPGPCWSPWTVAQEGTQGLSITKGGILLVYTPFISCGVGHFSVLVQLAESIPQL